MGARGVCVMLAGLLSAACNTVGSADVRPGGLVWTEDKSISWFSDLSGNRAGTRGWVFVRVMAPAGATACQADHSWFDGVNPFPQASVDKDGAALITVRNEIGEVGFSCATPSGVVRRKVASERFTISFRRMGEHSFWIVPPMVHMDPADSHAAARWDALHAELCPEGEISGIAACRPGVMQNMKLRDMGGGSPKAAVARAAS